MRPGARERLIEGGLAALALALATLAVVGHFPGHVSMDSSEQLFEAATGRSVSWSPPFMSAFLRILGGGTQATAGFVLVSVALTYGGMALAVLAGRPGRGTGGRRWLQRACIVLLFLNPLVFLHVGIVWKDVLLAALLAGSSGLLLWAAAHAGHVRQSFALAGLILLVPLLLVRQQGVVLAPPLALAGAFLLAGPGGVGYDRRRWLLAFAVLVAFAAACLVASVGVRSLIGNASDKSTSVGFAAIQRYDLTGMLATGQTAAPGLPSVLSSPSFRRAVARAYSADRLDIVLSDPAVVEAFGKLDSAAVSAAFMGQVRAHPLDYMTVKAGQLAWLLGLERLDRCLPVHVGVEGNADYLRTVGMPQGIDRHDQALFQLSLWSRQLVLHRHWFYVLVLLASCGWLASRTIGARAPAGAPVAWALAAGLLAFYGAYAVTTIACDFRYLYPGLVGSSVLAAYLLAAAGAPPKAGGPP